MPIGKENVGGSPGAHRLRSWLRKLSSSLIWTITLSLAFVVFAWLSIPTQLLAWRAVQEAQTRGFQAEIKDLSISPWGGVEVEGLVWHFERSAEYQTSVPFVVDRLELRASPLAYLFSDELAGKVSAEIGPGRLQGTASQSEREIEVDLKLKGLALAKIPRLQQTLNAPLYGRFGMDIDVRVPPGRWDKANGIIKLRCRECGLGDGETKLYVPGAKGMLQNGFTAPKVDFGALNGVVNIVNGKGTLENMVLDGEDIKIEISGTIDLQRDIKASKLDLTLKVFFKPKALADDKIQFLVSSASKTVKLEGAEAGGLGYKLGGTFARNRFRGHKSKTRAQTRKARLERRRKAAARRHQNSRAAKARPSRPSATARPSAKPAPDDDDDNDDNEDEDTPQDAIDEARRNIRSAIPTTLGAPKGPGGGAGRAIVPPNQ